MRFFMDECYESSRPVRSCCYTTVNSLPAGSTSALYHNSLAQQSTRRAAKNQKNHTVNTIKWTHLLLGVLLWRALLVFGNNDEVSPIPMNDQLLSLKGKAGPTLIWLVQIHTFVSCNDELEVLGGVTECGAAQTATMCVQLQMRIILH